MLYSGSNSTVRIITGALVPTKDDADTIAWLADHAEAGATRAYSILSNHPHALSLLHYICSENQATISAVTVNPTVTPRYGGGTSTEIWVTPSPGAYRGLVAAALPGETFDLDIEQLGGEHPVCYGKAHELDVVRQIVVAGPSTAGMHRLMQAGLAYAKDKHKAAEAASAKDGIPRYVYDTTREFWRGAGADIVRSPDTVFLRSGEKERIMESVETFLLPETKAAYRHHGVPYKLNLLFHGVPGTGKTSTINAIAQRFRLTVGIIPMTSAVTDATIGHALRSCNSSGIGLVLLEDIDCIFNDRKEGDTQRCGVTLSGLLNGLDGVIRPEGVIIAMTANKLDGIDGALLRSSRVDVSLRFMHADEDQTRRFFAFYFPALADGDDLWEALFAPIRHSAFTIATLQRFCLDHRGAADITQHAGKLRAAVAEGDGVVRSDARAADGLYN